MLLTSWQCLCFLQCYRIAIVREMVDISVVFTPVREEADDGVEEEQEDEEENEDLLGTHTEGGSGDDYGRGTVIRLGVERDDG